LATLGVPVQSFTGPLGLASPTKSPSVDEQSLRLVEVVDDVVRGTVARPTNGALIHQIGGPLPRSQLEYEQAR
jgi:hypothetical protein